jgi:hypothetical protein
MNKGIGIHQQALYRLLEAVHNLYFVVHDFQLGIILLDVFDDIIDDLVYVVITVTDATDTYGCYLPQVMVVYFGNRDIILISQSRHQRFNNPTLLFQRVVFGYMYFDLKDSGVHGLSFAGIL